MKKKAIICWSGGKDCALALYEIAKDSNFDILSALTTVTEQYDRTSMHGIRTSLLKAQGRSMDLDIEVLPIAKDISEEQYERLMAQTLSKFSKRGVGYVVFGDIFLADLRKHRQEKLSAIGMKAVFPLWGTDTKDLARQFTELGFRAIVTCVDTAALPASYAAREYDSSFVSQLPTTVDPCGENGEFHTFVYDGPVFRECIPFVKGQSLLRENRFYYQDLLPYHKPTVDSSTKEPTEGQKQCASR